MATKKASGSKSVTIERTEASDKEPGGALRMADSVVRTIAGLAARQVEGIYSLGKPYIVSFAGDKPTRGVSAEVGDREAAIDLDVVINYGCDLRETAEKLRSLVAGDINRMAGREVVEININVVDVQVPEQEDKAPEDHVRVR